MNRVYHRITPEIGQEQRDFVQNTGNRNAIFMTRMLLKKSTKAERSITMFHRLYKERRQVKNLKC